MQDVNGLISNFCNAVGYDYSKVKKLTLGKTIIQWTPKQMLAINVFQVDPLTEFKINQCKLTKESLERLERWLVDDNDFNINNTKKILKAYHGKLDQIANNST